MKRKASLIPAVILLIFAAVIALVTFRLRADIRAQILSQTGSILHATTHFEAARSGGMPLDLVLGMVDIDGVIGIRFYSPNLEPVAFLPRRLIAEPMPRANLESLRAADAVTVLQEHTRLGGMFDDPQGELSEEEVPILRVMVNLDDSDTHPLRGHVEFFVDGLPTAAAFRALDRDLLQQSLVAFAVGGGAILAVLLVSFRKLENKNRELAAANRELILHAKTSAIGAISANLFHGLKHAVDDLETAPTSPRLQAMIQDVIDVIQEDNHNLVYSVSGEEVLQFAADKLRKVAGQQQVKLCLDADPDVQFSNRQGNLLILAVQNLLHNAVEASPPGKTVNARLTRSGQGTVCTVRDKGPGVSEDEVPRLFDAGFSSKPAGSGLGLSISRQLCRFIGGELRLADTGPDGTMFEISVPEGRADSAPTDS